MYIPYLLLSPLLQVEGLSPLFKLALYKTKKHFVYTLKQNDEIILMVGLLVVLKEKQQ